MSTGERDLVGRAQQGDDRARAELARRHRKAAYVLALQLTGNREDAFDVSQEAMLRLFGNLGRLDRSRSVRPWLYTVVRNQVRDLWRRRKVRRSEPLAVEVGPEAGHQVVDRADGPERNAVTNEIRERLWLALSTLPEKHREILVLRDYQDLSYEDLAAVLGIPLGTVMSRLHAARKKLRAAYLEKGGTASA
ncbi:MAG: sigma-70 family RNA polymerase sigma factor [bacterium]|nr:sigma-70 family RNA polymerase sigma factor [bacterium]